MKPYIGDAIMAEPALRTLAGSGCETYVSTSVSIHQLLSGHFASNRFLVAERKRSLGATIQESRKLRQYGFDAAVLVNNSFRSALTSRLAGIPVRIGFAREKRDFLLSHRVAYDDLEFQAQSIARLLTPLGLDVLDGRPRLMASREERSQVKTRATIGFQPGARDPWKRLPTALAIEVARTLLARGERLAILGGSEERAMAAPIIDALGAGGEDMVGTMALRETLACLSLLDGCFGGDTGVMHMAVAAGCPTLQIFNSDRSSKWGHDYSPHRLLKAPAGDLSKLDPAQIADAVCAVALDRQRGSVSLKG